MSDTLRLILWPTILTALISVTRLVGEVQGWVTTRSGGALTPLGITWCVFVFGGWFGWRLARGGSAPRLRFAALWALLFLLATVGSVMWRFGPLLDAEPTDETFARLRVSVRLLAGIATTLALASFAVWPKLAWTMLVYALPARVTVLVLTWLAKYNDWNTHYTKFGPPGIERPDISDTLSSAAIAQFGFWVPFTIVGGTFAGALFGRVRKPKERAPDR